MTSRQYEIILSALANEEKSFREREERYHEGYDRDNADAVKEARIAFEARFKNESFN